MPQDIKIVVAEIQKDIGFLKINISEIKTLLTDHLGNYQKDKENMKIQNDKNYAGKWVESALSKISWLVVSSVIMAVLALVITNNVAK